MRGDILMHTVDPVIARGAPDALWNFMGESCRIPAEVFRRLPPADLPERDRRLLVHAQDMTSTLANFYGSLLRVEVLQQRQLGELYLREVFLRTLSANQIVEYGVIAVALEQFTPPQRQAVEGGTIPLGALLHQFQIPFTSAPFAFFATPGDGLAGTPLAAHLGSTCYGRFNRLAKPTGEPLAWILEILPPA